MNLRTAKRLHAKGVAAGRVTEFYHPDPKPPAPAPVEEEAPDRMPAGDILRKLLEKEKVLSDVLVLMRDSDGQLGFVTNLADLGESVLFIERVKHRILSQDHQKQSAPPPKGTA